MRVGRHGLIYGGGTLFNKGVAFLMLPFYTHFLTPADYGILTLVEMSLEIVSIVAGARLVGGVFYFFHKAEGNDDQNTVISTSFLVLAFSYTVIALATFATASWISSAVFRTSEYAFLIRIATVSLAFQGLSLVPMANLRLHERSRLYVVVNATKLAVQLTFNVLLLAYFGLGVVGMLISTLIASVLLGVGLSWHMLRGVGAQYSRRAAGDLVRLGLPLVATQFASFIYTFGDRFFLEALVGTAAVGLYSVAYRFGFLLVAVGDMPFTMVWEPIRFEVARRADRDEIYARAFVYKSIVLLSVAIVLILFVGDFLRLADPAFRPAARIVPLILVAYVFSSWSSFHNVGLYLKERTWYITLASYTAVVVALAGYALLIPRYFEIGAALATVIAFAVQWLIIYMASQRLMPVRYQWAPVLRLMGVAAAIGVLSIALSPQNVLISLGVRFALLIGYVGGVWYLGVVPTEARGMIKRAVTSPRQTLSAFISSS